MRFWHTSAIVPTFVAESSSSSVRALVDDDAAMIVWWATAVECTSALARLERLRALGPDDLASSLEALADLTGSWDEVPPSEHLRDQARRCVRVHELSAADALQLSAALVAADQRPETLPFVTLDERVALAASREGFPVLP